MSLILDDIIIIPVVVKWTVGDDMSLPSAESAFSFWTNRLVMTRGHPVAVRAAVVGIILSDMIPRPALEAREVGTMDWSWDWRMGCGIVMCWDIYINGIFPSPCCIGCSSHCLCVCDDRSDHPGSLGIETPSILGDESPLKDCLSGLTKTAWVRGGGDLWRRKLGRD